jgi:hypothetical protein
MGLDMYVYSTDSSLYKEDTIDNNCYIDGEELFYWRKHPSLHGWFRDLFYRKGGHRDSDFNGDYVKIEMQDLNNLFADIQDNNLPQTRGFFFGESIQDKTLNRDLEFIEKAKEAIENNKVLYYTSSW